MTRELTILPAVKVPVLSEHKTDMHPRVSIVARFLTRTCRFDMRRAMMVKESAKQRGSPFKEVMSEKINKKISYVPGAQMP